MDPTQRQLDLLAFLLQSRGRVSKSAIFDAFSDEYSASADAAERKLARDKTVLEELGVPIQWHPADDDDGEGYRIDRSAFYLPDIPLTPDERAALHAVAAVALDTAFPLRTELSFALAKLRARSPADPRPSRPFVYARAAGAGEVEDCIARALADRRRLRIRYSDDREDRDVDPWAFTARRGRFAMVGFCHRRDAVRTFYADRIRVCAPANPAASGPEFEVPADFDSSVHLPAHSWQLRVHAPVEVDLEFAPDLAESGSRALGLEPGSPCPATYVEGLVAEVLALGPGATIRSPDSARALLVRRLAPLARRLQEAP